jgi:hypothetical protein
MKSHLLTHLPAAAPVAAAMVLALALCACKSGPKATDKADAKAKAASPLILTPPTGRGESGREEKWVLIQEEDGQHYVQARDGMDDVVSFYGYISPYDRTLKSIDDLATSLRTDESLKFDTLRQSEVLGVPVLRFERNQEDDSTGDPSIQNALNTRGRTLEPPFFVQTIGAVMLHPGKPGHFVTVAVSRASKHGVIGTYYEALFEDVLASFVADNVLKFTEDAPR